MCVFVCYGLRVCGQKDIVIICDRLRKFVPRLNKHDDVIKWNFMKIAPPPPKWRTGGAPALMEP